MAHTTKTATKLSIKVSSGHGVHRFDHILTLSKSLTGSRELNTRLASIGNANRFLCTSKPADDGKTIITVAITSSPHGAIYTRKLHDILVVLANELHVPRDEVEVKTERGFDTTLAELSYLLDIKPAQMAV